MNSDRHLLADLREGDQQAFECIYDRYRNYLIALSTSLYPDPHLAEDIVHNVFISFYQNASQLQLRGTLISYLSAGIRNAIRDIFRRRAQTQQYDHLAIPLPEQEEPDVSVYRFESGQKLRQCLVRLPSEQRDVVLWRAYQDLSFTEIACRQSICSSTARGRYRYGIEKLGTLMRRAI